MIFNHTCNVKLLVGEFACRQCLWDVWSVPWEVSHTAGHHYWSGTPVVHPGENHCRSRPAGAGNQDGSQPQTAGSGTATCWLNYWRKWWTSLWNRKELQMRCKWQHDVFWSLYKDLKLKSVIWISLTLKINENPESSRRNQVWVE